MKKGLRIALFSVLGFLVLLFTGLQIALNSKLVTGALDKFAEENIDGTLRYSRLRVSLLGSFPGVRLTLDSLSVTYPTERFASFYNRPFLAGRFSARGRGEAADTLLRFDRLSVSVNPWGLLGGRIEVGEACVDGFSAFVHRFDAETSNLDILKFMAPSDTVSEAGASGSTPLISVEKLSLGERTSIVYTDAPSLLRACVDMDGFAAGAGFKMSDGEMYLRDAQLRMDSLSVYGIASADTLDLGVGKFELREDAPDKFTLDFSALARLGTAAAGRLELPAEIRGSVLFSKHSDRLSLGADGLTAQIAYLPLNLEGSAEVYPDSVVIDATAGLVACSVEKVLREYADKVLPAAAGFSTDALLTADISADGVYSRGRMPAVSACLRIPASATVYLPDSLRLEHAVDIDADLSPAGRLKADIHQLDLSVPGLDLSLGGGADELLGKDPLFRVSADARADVERLLSLLPGKDSLDIEHAEGDVHLTLDARARQSELKDFRFAQTDIKGALESRHLHLKMPSDSIEACVYNAGVRLDSRLSGLDLNADFDSVFFYKGAGLTARVRKIFNEAHISKVEQDGAVLPRIEVSTAGERVFFKSGTSRYAASGANVSAAVQKLAARQEHRHRRPRHRHGGEFDFADIDISLDSSIVKYLRNWSASGHIKADSGFFASPMLPLRTRLTALHADFDDEKIDIDTIGVKCGTSDVNLSGTMYGVKHSLIHKSMIRTSLNLDSRRLNVNEFLAAVLVGRENAAEVATEDENDESFVTDTLADARVDLHKFPIFVVPANLDVNVGLTADRVDFSDPRIGPVYSGIKIKDRTMQLTSTYITTELGKIYLDAFYATRSKHDISAGVNLNLSQMSAGEIIRLLPAVDSLMPVLKAFDGKLSCDISATAQIDTNRNVIIPTLDGLVRLSGKDLRVTNTGQFGKVANLLLFKKKETLDIDNMNVDALIHDSRIEVFPFVLGADKYRFALRGTQGFDKSMFYHLSVLKAPFPILFGINIYGTAGHTKVSLGRPKYHDGTVPVFTRQLDTVQINLAKSIRDIFDRGVESVMRHNESAVGTLDLHSLVVDPLQASQEGLDDATMQKYAEMADEFAVQQELQEQQDELDAEVSAALNSTSEDMTRMMKEYEASIKDRRFDRWLRKSRKK